MTNQDQIADQLLFHSIGEHDRHRQPNKMRTLPLAVSQFAGLSFVPILIIMLLLLTGCESPQLVEKLPSPNFNGPNVAAAPMMIAPVVPVAPAAPIVPPLKPVQVVGNIPREWIPMPGAKRDWYWIVIHHSATPSGSEKIFDREHRQKGWDECGYHFVIGNGTGSGNGQIEVGPRWPKQKYGAHAKTPDNQYNEHGIGICLVGNFEVDRPTPAQMASLNKLVMYLMTKYNIKVAGIKGHRETKSTECPGRNFNLIAFRKSMQQRLADASELTPSEEMEPITASAELLHDQATALGTQAIRK